MNLHLIKKKYSNFYILVFISFLLNIGSLSAQHLNSLESGYINFDKLVGFQNTNLYHGILYSEKYLTKNDDKQFFKSTKFNNGNLWFNGQPYFNKPLKYDVFEDELLLKIEENGNTLRLSKKDIDSFSIGNNRFINKEKITGEHGTGYYEVLFQDRMFILYAKHKKKIRKRKDKNYIYYEFEDTKSKYLLFYDGEYYAMNSKNDILKIFPNQKKQIKKLYKRIKRENSDDNNAFMKMLVKQLNSIL